MENVGPSKDDNGLGAYPPTTQTAFAKLLRKWGPMLLAAATGSASMGALTWNTAAATLHDIEAAISVHEGVGHESTQDLVDTQHQVIAQLAEQNEAITSMYIWRVRQEAAQRAPKNRKAKAASTAQKRFETRLRDGMPLGEAYRRTISF